MRRLVLALVLVLAACSSSAPTVAPPASPTEAPSPTPAPTATPTAEPTPVASVPLPVPVRVTKITKAVSPGDPASVTIFTLKGANCSIEVLYESGPSTAAGLDPQEADANGNATWSWTVGPEANPQVVPVTVTCTVPRRTGDVSADMTVK